MHQRRAVTDVPTIDTCPLGFAPAWILGLVFSCTSDHGNCSVHKGPLEYIAECMPKISYCVIKNYKPYVVSNFAINGPPAADFSPLPPTVVQVTQLAPTHWNNIQCCTRTLQVIIAALVTDPEEQSSGVV